MDLYIRSKDRTQIEKLRRIEFQPNQTFSFENGTSEDKDEGIILVNGRVFGEYTTEQGIEILDNIEEILRPTLITKQEKPKEFNINDFDITPIINAKAWEETRLIRQVETVIYQLPTF